MDGLGLDVTARDRGPTWEVCSSPAEIGRGHLGRRIPHFGLGAGLGWAGRAIAEGGLLMGERATRRGPIHWVGLEMDGVAGGGGQEGPPGTVPHLSLSFIRYRPGGEAPARNWYPRHDATPHRYLDSSCLGGGPEP